MSIKERVERLEDTLGAGKEPELCVIKLMRDDYNGQHDGVDTDPTDEERRAKLTELEAKNPGLSTHFAVWHYPPGEWRV